MSQITKRSALVRLFREDPGVEGCAWFHRRREDRYHVLANIIRVACNIIFAPLFILYPITSSTGKIIYNSVQTDWINEHVHLPNAVLRNPPEDVEEQNLITSTLAASRSVSSSTTDEGVYEETNFEPRWMLQVTFCNGQYTGHAQIDWTGEHRDTGYTALSYDMNAAKTLFNEAGKTLNDPKKLNGKLSLLNRRQISEQLLMEYCSAIRDPKSPNRKEKEFIWLDEFCLSRERHPNEVQQEMTDVKRERKEELGRMPDIYRGANMVVVFCHVVDCDHTTLDCSWGKRLYTLGEILHANEVQRMTRKIDHDESGKEMKQSHLYTEPARSFRERMMHHAARANRWHLHSILRQSNNSGSDTWQMAIHALIVDAIRRDRETKYHEHKFLGKGLNGLLPHRARLHHLKGEDGWADLAWLLELNQGFYNQAALAAVCCLPDRPKAGNGWLGPPIEPRAGNERLEPLVTAFVVGGDEDKKVAPLNIIGAQTIGLHPCLKRDGYALYRNPHARAMGRISMAMLPILSFIPLIMTPVAIGYPALTFGRGVTIYWLLLASHNFFRLIVGTMYLQRSGWVFLRESKWGDGSGDDVEWGSDLDEVLGEVDRSCTNLHEWGPEQMIPVWDSPGNTHKRGHLVDLRTGVKTRVVVCQKPNAMVVLGVHGSGVTYMLLDRPDNVNEMAVKVGMANLPPYTLATTEKCGSVRVGPAGDVAVKEQEEREGQEEHVSIWDKLEVLAWLKWLYTVTRESRVRAATDMA
uniref:Uncharacterized protein n=1 Tax=Moniliophthora roreri TaxID=221103 RepID=A0A0W0FDS6_MONRR